MSKLYAAPIGDHNPRYQPTLREPEQQADPSWERIHEPQVGPAKKRKYICSDREEILTDEEIQQEQETPVQGLLSAAARAQEQFERQISEQEQRERPTEHTKQKPAGQRKLKPAKQLKHKEKTAVQNNLQPQPKC